MAVDSDKATEAMAALADRFERIVADMAVLLDRLERLQDDDERVGTAAASRGLEPKHLRVIQLLEQVKTNLESGSLVVAKRAMLRALDELSGSNCRLGKR